VVLPPSHQQVQRVGGEEQAVFDPHATKHLEIAREIYNERCPAEVTV
jgi:hypothetical protein